MPDLRATISPGSRRSARAWRRTRPPGGPTLGRPVAVQAGVVTSDADAGRARAFFEGLGYRARTQGSPRLGTRVFVEARTAGQVEDIVAIAGQAGFVGAFPSRYVVF